jgi:hypothetical protein
MQRFQYNIFKRTIVNNKKAQYNDETIKKPHKNTTFRLMSTNADSSSLEYLSRFANSWKI